MPDEWWSFVRREDFFEFKDEPTAFGGMVKTCYSFGNNKRTYLYRPELEKEKSILHNFIVHNTNKKDAEKILGITIPELSGNKKQRRMQLKKLINTRLDLQSLERLERLESHKLEVLNLDYQAIPIKPNSVIYCDIPYKNKYGYGIDFDHERFYRWALRSPFPVYISEYEMPYGFTEVEMFKHTTSLAATKTSKTIEKIFWNGNGDARNYKLF